MHNQIRLIPVALVCIFGALALHYFGELGWWAIVPWALLSFVGAVLIVRSSAIKLS
jgi:hypothetical protein